VAPFGWGLAGDQVVALDRFLVTADRMMSRRHARLGERAKRQLTAAYEHRWQVSP
jgi:hypothetical protein